MNASPFGRFVGLEDELPAPVVLEQISDETFQLRCGFRFVDATGTEFGVFPGELPEGTDLASIPRELQFFGGRHGRHTLAALLHDARLEKNKTGPRRTEIDDQFRDALRALGIPRWRAWTMWAAVHLTTRFRCLGVVATVSTSVWVLALLFGTGWFWCSVARCFYLGILGACAGPFVGALFWLPGASEKWGRRYVCGLVAGVSAAVLLPFALVNAAVIRLMNLLDWMSRRKFPWAWRAGGKTRVDCG